MELVGGFYFLVFIPGLSSEEANQQNKNIDTNYHLQKEENIVLILFQNK